MRGMIDYENLKLLHRHGDEWLPMTVSRADDHHDAAAHDPERAAFHGWIYHCSTCEDEVAIQSQPEATADRS
jgi:hypothetical protein